MSKYIKIKNICFHIKKSKTVDKANALSTVFYIALRLHNFLTTFVPCKDETQHS